MQEDAYWNEFDLLDRKPGDKSENSPLNTAIYRRILNGRWARPESEWLRSQVFHAAFSGLPIQMSPWDTRPCSHDNFTGYLLSSRQMYLSKDIPWATTKKYWHPRDFFFYWGAYRKKFWAQPFLWLTSLCMIFSCLPKEKNSPGFFATLKILATGKFSHTRLARLDHGNVYIVTYNSKVRTDQDESILWTQETYHMPDGTDTVIEWHRNRLDGVRLNYARFGIARMPITEKICMAILRKFYGERPWQKIFFLYSLDSNDPIVVQARKAGI